MVKKKLAICGCSFMTSSYALWELLRGAIGGADWPDYPQIDDIKMVNLSDNLIRELERREYKHNYSFIDRYIKEKNFEGIHLAQHGVSNFFIRSQIDYAIKENVDYVIIGASESDRFEIPANSLHTEHIRKFNSKNYIMSTQIDHDTKFFPDNLISAVKYYRSYLQDVDIEHTKSYYLLRDGLTQLEKKRIPYVFIPGPMRDQDWTQNNIVWPTDEYQPWDSQNGPDPRGNHNNAQSHAEYFDTLCKITRDWK